MELTLAFDTETGGLDPSKTSLLTAYFVMLNENLEAIDELELNIKKEKREAYSVTAEALEINKINLIELHNAKESVTVDVARLKLFDFLKKHRADGANLIVPMAHNFTFDIGFVYEHLMPKETWDKFVDYHVLDTAVEANFLKRKGKIPKNIPTSLNALAKYFKMDLSRGALHTAKFDTVLMVGVLEEMMKL
jgi:DNA polymerase III alpha subunit (gram-positive type)